MKRSGFYLCGFRIAEVFLIIVFTSGLFLSIGGCLNKNDDKKEETKRLLLTGKRYVALGTVESVDIKEKKIRIRHGEIKGFMEPMTMWFKVTDGDLLQRIEKLNVNDKVRFELIGNESGMSIVISILKTHQ